MAGFKSRFRDITLPQSLQQQEHFDRQSMLEPKLPNSTPILSLDPISFPFATKISSRSPPRKLLQIRPRGHTQHKSSPLVRHDRKLLPLALSIAFSPTITVEEPLQLLQWCLHGDHLVHPAFPPKLYHRFTDGVVLGYFAGVEKDAEMRNREVA